MLIISQKYAFISNDNQEIQSKDDQKSFGRKLLVEYYNPKLLILLWSFSESEKKLTTINVLVHELVKI